MKHDEQTTQFDLTSNPANFVTPNTSKRCAMQENVIQLNLAEEITTEQSPIMPKAYQEQGTSSPLRHFNENLRKEESE